MIKANEIRIGNIFKEGAITSIPMQRSEQDFDVYIGDCGRDLEELNAVPLTPEVLEKAGFEDWGCEVINEWETCHYYAVHNFIEGTSDIKVCFITSNYGDSATYSEWVFKIDNDTIYNKGLEYFHQLQNLIFALTHQELTINLHATA